MCAELFLSAAVIISTAENPNSFDLFSNDGERQFVRQFAKEDDAGAFCIPLNISAANIEGVKDGSNVTIQVVFDGGDGALYQVLVTRSYFFFSVSDSTFLVRRPYALG